MQRWRLCAGQQSGSDLIQSIVNLQQVSGQRGACWFCFSSSTHCWRYLFQAIVAVLRDAFITAHISFDWPALVLSPWQSSMKQIALTHRMRHRATLALPVLE